jgi:hypothetical protein
VVRVLDGVRARLGAFGQTGPDPFVEYVNSTKRAEAEIEYLGNARASDWEVRARNASSLAGNEIRLLEGVVRGRLGDPEAEQKLFALWGEVHRTAVRMLENTPSVARQLADKVSVFFTDFWDGVKATRQDYSEWAIKNAGPLLRKFYDAASRSNTLKNELKALKASGQVPADLAQRREAELEEGDRLLGQARSVYQKISGQSLDALAQSEFGPYPALSGWQMIVLAAIAVVAIGALVVRAWMFMNSLEPLTEQAKKTIEAAQAAVTQTQAAAAATAATIQSGVETGKGAFARAAKVAEDTENIMRYLPWAIGAIALGGVAVAIYYFTKRD